MSPFSPRPHGEWHDRGNPQTDDFLNMLCLSHRWTVPSTEFVTSDKLDALGKSIDPNEIVFEEEGVDDTEKLQHDTIVVDENELDIDSDKESQEKEVNIEDEQIVYVPTNNKRGFDTVNDVIDFENYDTSTSSSKFPDPKK